MFNAPRPGQRYVTTSTNGFGGSFVGGDPLANSVYDDGLDPWSSAPSPASTPIPNPSSSSPATFSAVIADATVPAIYHRAFAAVDTSGLGETSVNSLSRVLTTSNLPASTIDRIMNLVSSRPRVSKLEFFVALALVALAQTDKDVSIEQVAALASQNVLPEPTLDLDRLPASNSTFTIPPPYRQNSVDPWGAAARFNPPQNPSSILGSGAGGILAGGPINGAQSVISGTGLPPEWWKRQENVRVTILGQQGFILNRYTVYEITAENGVTVTRRYSEFVYLWEVLTRRYPFRLFPALPPKRIGPDEHFLEQRRRGLQRALNFVINHPVVKEDGVLAVFLSVPSFEVWRKQTSVSLDEESLSKRVDRVEEMAIPSDFEEKLTVIRTRLNPLIEQWQRICILAERIMKRHEAAAVRLPPALRRAYLPTHFTLPNFSPVSSTASLPGPSPNPSASLNHSFLGLHFPVVEEQGDLARLTNTLRAVIEVNEHCWRGDECDLSNGVRQGLDQLAIHTQRHSDLAEVRTRTLLDTTLESLKAQRDLYIATRDLLVRHDRLSGDQVERLKKRVETNSVKLDGVRAAAKEGWQEEADKLTAIIEKDQGMIAAQLSRRVFIRVCLWNELRIILHNRENTLLTQAVQAFARGGQQHAEDVLRNWVSLRESVEDMPYE